MREITRVEAGFHRNHVPLWLLLGILGVGSRIRKAIESSARSTPARDRPTEFDQALLGILSLESRVSRMIGSTVEVAPPVATPQIETEHGMLR